MSPANTGRPLNVPALAQRLGCSPQTVTRLIEGGHLGALDVRTRVKHAYRVGPDHLAAFQAARATSGGDRQW